MDTLNTVIPRDEQSNNRIIDLMIATLSLILVAIVLAGVVLFSRKVRRDRQLREQTLPQYHDFKRTGNHRRLTIETFIETVTEKEGKPRSSIVIYSHGQPMLANPHSPPNSPDNVPEIHITFPDEQDDAGRPRSGRVLLVRVGDATVGLEPLSEEQLPAYEKDSSSQFYAIDLENIGGLKEKYSA